MERGDAKLYQSKLLYSLIFIIIIIWLRNNKRIINMQGRRFDVFLSFGDALFFCASLRSLRAPRRPLNRRLDTPLTLSTN